jgi:DNA-binding NarL/FixJ family response regulator
MMHVPDEPTGIHRLGTHHREILLFLAGGATDHAIGQHLGLSLRTVRRLVQQSIDILDAEDRHDAVGLARLHGLLAAPNEIPPPP